MPEINSIKKERTKSDTRYRRKNLVDEKLIDSLDILLITSEIEKKNK